MENWHSDSDFEATLLELDEREFVCKKEETPVKEMQQHTSECSETADAAESYKQPRNDTKETLSKSGTKLQNEKKESNGKGINKPSYHHKTSSDLPVKNKKSECAGHSATNETNHQKKVKRSPAAVKRDDSSFSDNVFEKKRQHAMQYQRYLQREGPKNPGGKEVPQVLV